METIRQYYKINREEICFLKSIIEAYDGMAVLRTIDVKDGIIELSIIPGGEGYIRDVLDDLKKHIRIKTIQKHSVPLKSTFEGNRCD